MKAVLFFLIVFLWDLSVASPGLSMDPKEEQSVPGDHTSGEPVKAPLSLKRDWSGPYVGAHLGYAGGSSQVGTTASTLGSSLNFYKGFRFSKGTGSYLGGFQAGYNYMLPWNLVLGVEGDISFPNTLTGSQQISAPSLGNVSYADTIEYFGSARSRIGYAIHNWLIYGTAGFAWSYDEFALAPVSGVPAGGNAAAGINTSTRQWRTGWTAGAGVEVALAPHWSTKIEYLFSDLGGNSVSFPAGVARLTSDLTLHEVRLGINYSLSEASAKWEDLANGRFSVHGQSTFVNQYAPGFHDPYRGTNSFIPKTGRETWDATLYLGARLWPGAELWINPEIDQGFGLSKTLGVAGYPSGEAYKVGNNFPYARIPRMFIRQTIGLSGSMEEVAPSLNQFAAARLSNRLVITAGKFGVPDVFDTNKYAHARHLAVNRYKTSPPYRAGPSVGGGN